MPLANTHEKIGDAPSPGYSGQTSGTVDGAEAHIGAITRDLAPKSLYTLPEATDYLVRRLDQRNLKLPGDQPRMLAEMLAKGIDGISQRP